VQLLHALDTLGPFEPSPHLAVATSGGSDSMALALLADTWAKQRGGRITALTVDHRLRPESSAEAAQVARWCAEKHITHHTLTPAHTEAGNNLQSNARTWRYGALTQWCRTQHVLHLLLAHHQGDQLETHLLMQARGATTDGAAAMPRVRVMQGVRLLRPLLAVTRSELQAFLEHQHQPYISDPSNDDTRFARVRLRTHLQTTPHDTVATLHSIQHAAAMRQASDRELANAAYACCSLWPDGSGRIHAPAFFALEPQLATALLANMLRCLRGTHTRPRQHETLRLYEALKQPECKATLHVCRITRTSESILLTREPNAATGAWAPVIPLAQSAFWA